MTIFELPCRRIEWAHRLLTHSCVYQGKIVRHLHEKNRPGSIASDYLIERISIRLHALTFSHVFEFSPLQQRLFEEIE
jgi:hypothetical protein